MKQVIHAAVVTYYVNGKEYAVFTRRAEDVPALERQLKQEWLSDQPVDLEKDPVDMTDAELEQALTETEQQFQNSIKIEWMSLEIERKE